MVQGSTVLLRSATSDSDTQPGYGILILCYLVQRTKWESLSLYIDYNLSKYHTLLRKDIIGCSNGKIAAVYFIIREDGYSVTGRKMIRIVY